MSELNDTIRKFINRRTRLKKLQNLKAPEFIINSELKLIADVTAELREMNFDIGTFMESNLYDKMIKDVIQSEAKVDEICERCGSCSNQITVYKGKQEDVGCKEQMFVENEFYPDKCDKFNYCGMDYMDRTIHCSNQCLKCLYQGTGDGEFGDEYGCLIKTDNRALNCIHFKERK